MDTTGNREIDKPGAMATSSWQWDCTRVRGRHSHSEQWPWRPAFGQWLESLKKQCRAFNKRCKQDREASQDNDPDPSACSSAS